MSLGESEATLGEGLERPAPPPRRDDRNQRGRGRGLPLAIGAVAVAVFVGSVWYAYQQGTRDAGIAGESPLARADARPTKLKPESPGGLKVPNQDKLVYQRLLSGQPDKRVERLLPVPETPLAKPGTKPSEATADAGSTVVAVAPTKAVPPKITEKPKPPPKRATTLTIRQVVAPPAPVAAVAPKQAAAPTPLTPKRFAVQLASLRKPGDATGEWRRLRSSHDSVLGGLKSRVIRADLGAKGVYYRLVAGPFQNDADARGACRRLRAQKQGCLVVPFD